MREEYERNTGASATWTASLPSTCFRCCPNGGTKRNGTDRTERERNEAFLGKTGSCSRAASAAATTLLVQSRAAVRVLVQSTRRWRPMRTASCKLGAAPRARQTSSRLVRHATPRHATRRDARPRRQRLPLRQRQLMPQSQQPQQQQGPDSAIGIGSECLL